jgi:uncharacterized membrane protein YeaQ/YmgE (transglycosylase-associated protein family)
MGRSGGRRSVGFSHSKPPTTTSSKSYSTATVAKKPTTSTISSAGQQRRGLLSSFAGGMMGAFAGSLLFGWLTGHGRNFEVGDFVYGAAGAAAGMGATWLLKNRAILVRRLLRRKDLLNHLQFTQYQSPSGKTYLIGAGLGGTLGIMYNGKRVVEREEYYNQQEQ